MSTIQVEERPVDSPYGKYYTVTVGSKKVEVTRYNDGRVGVYIGNEQQKVWKSMGKYFRNVVEALQNYKNPDIKAAILATEYKGN